MNNLPRDKLSSIEREVVEEIRALRTSSESSGRGLGLRDPVRLVRHFTLRSHGSVQLRFSTLATELGVEMRTLERTFVARYQKTMMEFQSEIRLAFAKQLLSVSPPTKISAVAAILGYNAVQDFNRFFQRHVHQSPSAWGKKERERIAGKVRNPPND